MPYYDEGESSSSESTTPEEVKVTEWLILGANLQELSLELADFTSKCSQVTPRALRQFPYHVQLYFNIIFQNAVITDIQAFKLEQKTCLFLLKSKSKKNHI